MATDVIYAYHNHGRWIAECPQCKWAIVIPRGYVDFVCGITPEKRGAIGCGFAAKIQWPARVDDIEAALRERSRIENRNWLPGETVIDLLAQTLERERA